MLVEGNMKDFLFQEKLIKANGQENVYQYKVVEQTGNQEYWIARNLQDGHLYTVKIVAKQNLVKARQRQYLFNEIKILNSLQSPSILNYIRVFEDQQNIYILYEYFSTQTLYDLYKSGKLFTEWDIQQILFQIINGLKYLQDYLIIHRNPKMNNIFIDQNKIIKIGGFNYATKLTNSKEKKYSIIGSQNYFAPEILLNKGYSFEVDVWALGNIVYALVCGKSPFTNEKSISQAYQKIKMNQIDFPENIHISYSLQNLIKQLLDPNPSKRPLLDDILSHKCFQAQNMDKFNEQA